MFVPGVQGMALVACGAAVADRSGAIVAADGTFLSLLGLPADDPPGALRALARERPDVAEVLSAAGRGPAVVPWGDGAVLEVERAEGGGLRLLVLRQRTPASAGGPGVPPGALAAVASGIAHDIRNPLNAMALQVALLAEKLAAAPPEVEAERHLGTVRDQIRRVDEAIRRLVDVADPPGPIVDAGSLVRDAAGLLGHEARRRGVALEVDAARLAVEASDPGKLGHLVLGLLAEAIAATPTGGTLAVRTGREGGRAVVTLERTAGPGTAAALEPIREAARELDGSLEVRAGEGAERIVLSIPGGAPP